MTCIVGIAFNGKVYIGGDTLGSDGFRKGVYDRPKVFKNNDFIIGYTTSYRMGQLLEASFIPPERLSSEKDDFIYIVNRVIPAIKSCLSRGGFEQSHNGKDEGGVFLLGYKGNLYEVQSEYSILKASHMAIGSGIDHAMGALSAIHKINPTMTPEEKITIAIEAAMESCLSVGGSVDIVSN